MCVLLVGTEKSYEVEIGRLIRVDQEKMIEVGFKSWACVVCNRERECACKLSGFTYHKSADPHHCPSRVVWATP